MADIAALGTAGVAPSADGPSRILVVNAGSSSLRLAIADGDRMVSAVRYDLEPGDPVDERLAGFVERDARLAAVGHRFVHGGPDLRRATVVDRQVLGRLERLADLDPLHATPALQALHAARTLVPGVPSVACFDTAFHATMPAAAAHDALPWPWIERHGVRRYGFHGLSHSSAARRTAELLGRPLAELRIVVCHLGAGASLAAIAGGRSVDTTMGFTPLDGLVMATRSGSVDPGAILWLQRHAGLSADDLARGLEREAGLLGLSGVSGDMRAVQRAAERGHERARLALDVYHHRLRANIAAMVAALGGLDALVFTGGVGENAPGVRARAVAELEFLGVALDSARNSEQDGQDALISDRPGSPAVLVVHAREELEIADQVRSLIGG